MNRAEKTKNQNGIALVITMGLIFIITAATLEIAKRTTDYTLNSAAETDMFQAEQMAWSGINLAVAILAEDRNNNDTDSVQEIWADSLLLRDLVARLGFDKGNLSVLISDELGKIQVNALIDQYPGYNFNQRQKQIWERLLDMMISSDKSIDIRDPSEIINSLKDWLDSNDNDIITGLSGGESEYYENLDHPYKCANSPLNTLEELLMIKGIKNLFDSGKNLNSYRINENTDLSKFDLDLNIYNFLTVFGLDPIRKEKRLKYPGKININTANTTVIAAILPDGMEHMASELTDFRIQKGEDQKIFLNSLEKKWYKKVLSLSGTQEEAFEKIIRYSSQFFKIEANAQINTSGISLTGVVVREKNNETGKWGCKILRVDRT